MDTIDSGMKTTKHLDSQNIR